MFSIRLSGFNVRIFIPGNLSGWGGGGSVESPLSFFRMHLDHEPPPHPTSGHPLPLRGGEGRGEGAVHREGGPTIS